MKKGSLMGEVAVVVLSIWLGTTIAAMAEEVPRLTKESLKSMLGAPDLIIVDVRTPPDWESSEAMIKGAIREDPSELDLWIDIYPKDKTLVFYCS